MNKRFLALGLVCTMGLTVLGGCGKSKEETTETEAVNSSESYTVNLSQSTMLAGDANDVIMMKDGMIISDLTGEWVPIEQNEKRPIALMVNNIIDSMPQSGIGQADVIFEFLEEGGITRLMPIWSNWDGLERMGSCRSARYYYDRKAVEFDAIFCHFGQNYLAEADFESYNYLDHIDGNSKDNEFFYRTEDREAPHNAYTSGKGIDGAIAANGFETKHRDYYQKTFYFNMKDETPSGGQTANKITTAYNADRKPWFEYDSSTGLYNRFQYGEAQIDDTTGEQLKFKNVIIQFVKHSVVPGEEASDLQDIWLVDEGEGYYASDGVIVPITWKKESSWDCTHYYTKDGEKLKMNPGKTWVTIFRDDETDNIIIE
ncbi:MAG: DUF3048 domain-containing protein [Eubacterium sp.]|nr:DUF3048 domain-containing protein [Eubacterium sp.]